MDSRANPFAHQNSMLEQNQTVAKGLESDRSSPMATRSLSRNQ
jgi:hypothetical protein